MKRKSLISQIALIIFFTALCVLVILPFLLLLGVSFSSENDVIEYGYSLIPRTWSLEAYRYVFKNPTSVFNAYKVTATYSFIAMFLSVLLQAMCAFPLTRKNLKGRNAISFYLYFTMLFSGGLVPAYILRTQYLHLDNTIWIYIIPTLISPWNIFMMRTFFAGLPEEIFESMQIDGASVYNMFFKTVLPLSKPVLATIALMTFLGKWNDWYTAMLYIDDDKLISLQYLLQKIMQNLKMIQELGGQGLGTQIDVSSIPGETSRMAMAVVVAGPALVVFPFFQKYFVKGLTVGSVKG